MKKIIVFWMTLILIISLSACSDSSQTIVSTSSEAQTSAVAYLVEQVGSNETTDMSDTSAKAETVQVKNSETHEDADDYVWDSATVVPIILNGDSISVESKGVTVNGSTATITAGGTYSLSGTLNDGQIIVDTIDEAVVRLILNRANLNSTTSAPIVVNNAEKTIIVLAENTENTVTDAASYIFPEAETDEPNAAIFSTADLTLYGSGSLTVNGNYNDGIASKDGLIIASGNITVNAVDDGIRGKDYLVIEDGEITVNAQGDGLKSDNEEDAARGYVSIANGVIHISSGGDAISAQTDVSISGGQFSLTSGGGVGNYVDETLSAKGIKGLAAVTVDSGSFTISSADDAIHSNGSVVVNGGIFTIASGDDGMHADTSLEINGGEISITESYEGIESAVITINNGDIDITASDDGINVAGGVDSSGMMPGGRPGGGPGQDAFSYTGDYYLYINGGTIVVNAGGDGLDVNGAIEMTDGLVVVHGPTEQMNAALDYDGYFNISGGVSVAAGSAGMAMTPSQTSSQNSTLIYFTSTLLAGTLVHIQNSAGEEIMTLALAKDSQTIAFSSPELVNGETYTIFTGGNVTGVETGGLYLEGSYYPGSEYASFTVSGVVTMIGSGSGGGGRRQRP